MRQGGRNVQPSKTGLYLFVVRIVRDVEDLVEVAILPQPVVGLVNCIEKVGYYHDCLNTSTVRLVAWRARLGLWVASTNGNSVVYGLDPT